jgi:hypothetical protein
LDLLDGGRAEASPHYCPRCDRARDPAGALCEACGERLRPQGYCGVCEAYWRHPEGADCPKHDIPLDAGPPPRRPALEAGPPAAWVTVASFHHVAEVEAPRIRLEAEGIPTFLDGRRMAEHALHPSLGGVRLQVPRPLAAEARVLLGQSWSWPDEDDDLDDAWDELAPDPSARRRAIMQAIVVLLLALPLLRVLVGLLLAWLA